MKANELKNVGVGISRFVENEQGEIVPVLVQMQSHYSLEDENLFHHFGWNSINSAAALKDLLIEEKHPMTGFGNIPAFLYLQGLELIAKGELYQINGSVKDMDKWGKQWGHRLNDILLELKKEGMDWDEGLSPEDRDYIIDISTDYHSKCYNYAKSINDGTGLHVDVVKIDEVVQKIVDTIMKQ